MTKKSIEPETKTPKTTNKKMAIEPATALAPKSLKKDGRSLAAPPYNKRRPPERLTFIAPNVVPARGLRGEGEPELLERLRERESLGPEDRLISASSVSYGNKVNILANMPRIGPADLGSAALQQITNTEDQPWRCICHLVITPSIAGLGTMGGTGWLVGSRTIITAGHCVFQRYQGQNQWASEIKVVFGRNGRSSSPFGVQYVREAMYSVEGWVEWGQEESDYGALILSEPVDHGSFGCDSFSDADLQGALVTLAGYPLDDFPASTYGTLWGESDYLSLYGDAGRRVRYPIVASGGTSGAPLFVTVSGKRYVVAIHNYGQRVDLNYSLGTRITDGVLEKIHEWRNVT